HVEALHRWIALPGSEPEEAVLEVADRESLPAATVVFLGRVLARLSAKTRQRPLCHGDQPVRMSCSSIHAFASAGSTPRARAISFARSWRAFTKRSLSPGESCDLMPFAGIV